MAKYERKEVGLVTKQKIVNSAKDLFYENGYLETTIKEICENAKVQRSSFFYYFNDKAEIADFISNHVNLKFYDEVQKDINIRYKEHDSLLVANLYSAIFFLSILEDKKLSRFYGETLRNISDTLLGDAFYRNLFKIMYRYSGHDPNDTQFEIFFSFHTSTPGNLINRFLKGIIKTSKEDVVEYILRRVLLGLDIKDEKQDRIICLSMQYAKETKISFRDIFFQPWEPLSSENNNQFIFF